MTEVEAYRALSSKSRLQIMKVLYRKSLSVDEIARKLGLHPITVRHHLQSLEEAGFIETYEKRTRGFGRPTLSSRLFLLRGGKAILPKWS